MRPRGWTDVGERTRTQNRESSKYTLPSPFEKRLGVQVFGHDPFSFCNTRVGYLFNIRPVLEYENPVDSDKLVKRSALSLYFIDEEGFTFRSTLFFSPYFYVDIFTHINETPVDDVEHKMAYICQLLNNLALEQCREKVDVFIEWKIDLQSPQHIRRLKTSLILTDELSDSSKKVYRKKPLIKIVFLNIEDFRIFRREIENKKKVAQKLLNSFNSKKTFATYDSDKNLLLHFESNPLLYICDIFEADLNLVARVCIDLNIRCGTWYNIDASEKNLKLYPCDSSLQATRPLIKYLAWDIEVTKEPLRFPDSQKDSITLISYMCDGQGFLIVNREFVKEDIANFEYTPKECFPGHFHVFNLENEKEVLLKFLSHIRELKPHILVTYNGDNFDFEFVRVRCELLEIFLLDEIGFPYSSSDGIPPIIAGLPSYVRTMMGDRREFQGRVHVHIDCLRWVERDSYLPCGSRGLKAVTRLKLGYEPRELDPELMTQYAEERPYALAEYSVSDAVATYYLYAKYIHSFTFALASIIPLPPDDILRKGSGTLCEHLLMAEAFKEDILIPNKHVEVMEKWYKDKLLYSETYSGGSVAQLLSGVYRSDIPETFQLDSQKFQELIDLVDEVIDQFFKRENEAGIDLDVVENLAEVKHDIITKLQYYRDNSECIQHPLIYHYDVGAMYPNIILSNRLQPTSIIHNISICQQCPYYNERDLCQKSMTWLWKGEHFPLAQGQIEFIRDQLSNETFTVEDESVKSRKLIPVQQSSDSDEESDVSSHGEPVTMPTKQNAIKTNFRDRRNIFKAKKRVAEQNWRNAKTELQRQQAQSEVVLYDSLQLAHKCILNTFYGYVMRKGSRWYSMEMAAIVTYTGAQIIKDAFLLSSAVGKPLELDTDGIWTMLPENFPRDYTFKYKTSENQTKTKRMNYFCTLLNLGIFKKWSNNQYLTWNDQTYRFDCTNENSVFFEVDGPYKAMLLPASEKEGQSIKKRYAVFNNANEIVELKGFEIKRRGELPLLKLFQQEIFSEFTKGTTKQEAYAEVAKVANRWLNFIENHGSAVDNLSELFEFIGETKYLSKSVKSQEHYKSLAITTARRLTELFGDPSYITDKGIKCQFVVCAEANLEKSLRAVPIQLFEASPEIQKLYLQRWLGLHNVMLENPRELFDWEYYKQRLQTAILKIIIIPALSQGLSNPISRVQPPEWIRKAATINRSTQSRLSYYFGTNIKNSATTSTKKSSSCSLEKSPVEIDVTEIQAENDLDNSDVVMKDVKSSDTIITPALTFSDWFSIKRKEWKSLRDNLSVLKKGQLRMNSILNWIAPHRKEFAELPLKISDDVLIYYKNDRIINPTWLIVNILATKTSICWFCIRLPEINNKLYKIPVNHYRRIILNCKSRFHFNNKEIVFQELKKTTKYMLPRKLKRLNLFELLMPKDVYAYFNENSMTDGDVVAAYNTLVPESFDFFAATVKLKRAKNLLSGLSVRLRSLYKEASVFYKPDIGEYIQGRMALEPMDISFEIACNSLTWIYVYLFHLEGTKFVVYIYQPPLINTSKPNFTESSGFTITFIVDDSLKYVNQLNKLNMRQAFALYAQGYSGHKPYFLNLPETETLLKHWIFLSPESFETKEDMIDRLKRLLNQSSIRIEKNGNPPLGVFIYNCIPPYLLQDIFSDNTNLNKNYVTFNCNANISFEDLPKFSSDDFIGFTFRFSIDELFSSAYLIEWSSQVSYATQIPIFQTLEWNSSPSKLQHTILDVAFNKALYTNCMVSWASESNTPDLGTPEISAKSSIDFELPELDSNANFVSPGLYWTLTYKINLGKQLPLETIMNLNYLAEEFDDPLKNEFRKDQKTVHFGTRTAESDSNSSSDSGDDYEDALYGRTFQHSSQVPEKTLAVLKTTISYLKSRFEKPKYMDSVYGFLRETLLSVGAWLNSEESFLYDPALANANQKWGKSLSQFCLIGYKKLDIFSNLMPLKIVPYRGFIIYDHTNSLGYCIEKPYGWDNQLSFLECLPSALSYVVLKSIKTMISLPFKAAGISPTDNISSDDITKIETIACNILNFKQDKYHLIKSWLRKINEFDVIKEEWFNSNMLADWEQNYRQELAFRLRSNEGRMEQYSSDHFLHSKLMRENSEIKDLLNLSSEALIEQGCWIIPKRPGMITIENEEKLVCTIKDNNLQSVLAKLLHYTVTLNSFYKDLSEEEKEAIIEEFASVAHLSSYTEFWGYQSLCTNLCLNGFTCQNCSLTYTLLVITSLIDCEYDQPPKWECPNCKNLLEIEAVEMSIISILTDMIEAAQVQDILCTVCKRIKTKPTATYCACGGKYKLRIPEIKFMLIIGICKSLVDYFPSHLPWLSDYLQEIISIDMKCQKFLFSQN